MGHADAATGGNAPRASCSFLPGKKRDLLGAWPRTATRVAAVRAHHEAPVEPGELRVLVADDDPLVRSAVREALSSPGDIRIDGEASNGEQAVAIALRRRPDVVLLDVGIPRVDAITVTRRIHQQAPDVHVVVFSSSPDDELGLLGLRAGAVGFLLKDVTSEALARALRGIARGEAAVSRTLTRQVLDYLHLGTETGSGMRPVWSTLTSREWQVLDLLCEGRATEEIADRLVLSVETIRTHVKHVLAKLGAHSRAEAIAVAKRLRAGDTRASEGLALDELARRRLAHGLRDRAPMAPGDDEE
jgi:NarL family two-component system response regulator LiaR